MIVVIEIIRNDGVKVYRHIFSNAMEEHMLMFNVERGIIDERGCELVGFKYTPTIRLNKGVLNRKDEP